MFSSFTYRFGDRLKPVETDEHNVEYWGGAQHIIHNQPQFTQPSAQPPLARQDVGNIHGDAKPSYIRLKTKTRIKHNA